MNFDAALARKLRDAASPGARTLNALPCDRCVGRSLNLCKPLDDARLQVMLGLGGIRRWRKRETVFRTGDPMGAFLKIRSGVVAVSRTLDDGRRQIGRLDGMVFLAGIGENDAATRAEVTAGCDRLELKLDANRNVEGRCMISSDGSAMSASS